ncbi:MAG TPA: hypothetical protein VIL36_09840 [Acidimicrobiales bacterium]
MDAVAVVDALAGGVLVAVAAATLRSRRRRFGVVAVGAALAWCVAGVAGPLVYLHRPLLAHAALAYPSGRLGTPAARAVVGCAWLGALVLPVGRAPVVTLVLGAGLLVAAWWPGAPTGLRTGLRTDDLGAPVRRRVALVLAVAFAGPAAVRLGDPVTPLADAVTVGHALAVAVAGALLLVAALLRVGGPADAADAVVELAARRAPVVEAVLADARMTDVRAGDIDAAGVGAGERVAAIDDPGVRDALGRATELLARNSALQADLEAQVAKVRASRRRLVEVVDVERRRMERRLLTGPGRLLDELEGELAALADLVPGDGRTRVARLQGEIAGLRDDLARLGRGLPPARLADDGLRAALDDLAARAPVPATVAAPDRRFPAVVEATLWYVCAEALANVGKHAGARSVRVAVEVDGAWALAEVVDDGVGGTRLVEGRGLAGLHDRLDAVGGRLDVGDGPDGGTCVRAWVPVA